MFYALFCSAKKSAFPTSFLDIKHPVPLDSNYSNYLTRPSPGGESNREPGIQDSRSGAVLYYRLSEPAQGDSSEYPDGDD